MIFLWLQKVIWARECILSSAKWEKGEGEKKAHLAPSNLDPSHAQITSTTTAKVIQIATSVAYSYFSIWLFNPKILNVFQIDF